MPKRKAKKAIEFNNSMVKTVFFYGEPNKEKYEQILKLQKQYTDAVNRFIDILSDEQYLPFVIQKQSKSAEMRALEKAERKELPAAYSQAAFDEAMDKVYNRIIFIKNEIYGISPSVLTSRKTLFASALMHKTQDEMCALIDGIIDSIENRTDYKTQEAKEKKKQEYVDLKQQLAEMNDFDFQVQEVNTLYQIIADGYRMPHVKSANIRVVSTAHKLKKSNNIKAPYVLNFTSTKGRERIEVPLNTSKNSLRRLTQYGKCGTIEVSTRKNGTIRVSVPFKKKLSTPACTSYVGVDVGISDTLHSSANGAIGSLFPVEDFYKSTVEPAFAEITKLRNKKGKLKRFLKKHKTLPEDVVFSIRRKMDRLEKMIRKTKYAYRKDNQYHNMLQHEVKLSVDKYIESLRGDKSICTVMEKLDINEFRKSKKVNSLHSMFARGFLTQKLIDGLNWHGFSFLQVEPAYTSQTCPVCSYVSKDNRSAKSFKCQCCGYEDDADHVGSLNICSRAEDTDILQACEDYKYNKKHLHNSIKDILLARNEQWQKDNKPAS